MSDEYKKVDLSSDEVIDLFRKMGIHVELTSIDKPSPVTCKYERCEGFGESNGHSTDLILTNDDYIFELFNCEFCKLNHLYIAEAIVYDKDFYSD